MPTLIFSEPPGESSRLSFFFPDEPRRAVDRNPWRSLRGLVFTVSNTYLPLGPQTVRVDDMHQLHLDSREACTKCGVATRINPHSMDKSKVQTLMDMAILHRDGNEWIRAEQGRGLMGLDTKTWRGTAYCADKHVYRCAHFGLTEQRERRKANWKVTTDGYRFLKGELAVAQKVLSTKRRVFYVSAETVFLHQVRDVIRDKEYWDTYPWSDFIP